MRPRRKQNDVTDPWDAPDPALALAVDQLAWYARNRDRARNLNSISEVLLLLTAAGTTLAAALEASPWATATLAATSLVVTGLRKISDWHENWIAFATAWADLRTAIHQHHLQPDRLAPDAQHRLVSAVDDIVTAETTRWATRRRTRTADKRE